MTPPLAAALAASVAPNSTESIDAETEAYLARVQRKWEEAKPAQLHAWYRDGKFEPILLTEEPLDLNECRTYITKSGMKIALSDKGMLTPLGMNGTQFFTPVNGYLALNEDGQLIPEDDGTAASQNIKDLVEQTTRNKVEAEKIVEIGQYL